MLAAQSRRVPGFEDLDVDSNGLVGQLSAIDVRWVDLEDSRLYGVEEIG